MHSDGKGRTEIAAALCVEGFERMSVPTAALVQKA
jgi:hypothetical protein